MKKQCNRCRKKFDAEDLIDWIDDMDTLSPKYCVECYNYILDHYEIGDDVESME